MLLFFIDKIKFMCYNTIIIIPIGKGTINILPIDVFRGVIDMLMCKIKPIDITECNFSSCSLKVTAFNGSTDEIEIDIFSGSCTALLKDR